MDRFRQLWHVNGGVTHKEPVFRDTLFTWDNLGVTYQFTISLFEKNLIYLGTVTPRAVSNKMAVAFLSKK